ncbi:hypothetical protein [Haloferax profundi]|uniref:hypothetical protein n=1 Tax=Haloferax profundi TaxID=1544718 RepID=UPI000A94B546|nr:hypothetical protein [Haloferax profundi]
MDPTLTKKLDAILALLFLILVAEAYRAAGVLGLVLALVLGGAVLTFSNSTANHSSASD